MKTKYLQFKLSDGRILAYSECGDPKGFPVLFFHGTPGSRLQSKDFNQQALSTQCRFFGIDRPGMGYSSPNKKHSIMNFTSDIQELVNFLEIDKVAIIAHSGGAPFALAYAATYVSSVSQLAIVSGIAPTTLEEASGMLSLSMRIINMCVRFIPGFAFILMYLTRLMHEKTSLFKQAIKKLPEPDKKILNNTQHFHTLVDSGNEAFRQGLSAAAQEFKIVVSDWGFDISQIKCPVSIWHGGLDQQVSLSNAKFFQKLILNAKLIDLENEGHLSVLYNHMSDILKNIHTQSNLLTR